MLSLLKIKNNALIDEIELEFSKGLNLLTGETGSGKTTQLPKIALAAGGERFGLLGHTQPRRIAARSVAERSAQEPGDESGRTVGFKARVS